MSEPAAAVTLRPSLYVVDAMNLIFRAFHALPPLTTSRGVQTGAVLGLCNMLLKIEREYRPTHLCAVFDAPGRTFRDEISPTYKATRSAMPDELASQIPLVHDALDAFGVSKLCVDGVEADDVIATLARQAVAVGMDVVICSSDKDLMQLCGEHIMLLDTMKTPPRRIGRAEVEEKFGVAPEKVAEVLALTGDSIDNVPGVPGIGPKTAAKLIQKFGSVGGLLGRISEVEGKVGSALAAGADTLRVSRHLVALKEDVALPRTLADLHRSEPDPARLLALFRKLELTRLEKSFEEGEINAGFSRRAPAAAAPAPASAPASRSAGLQSTAGPPPRAEVISDAAALARFCGEARSAGAMGLAVLAEGPDPVRAGLVGIAFTLPSGARHYLPLAHRYLGAPSGLREGDALPVLAPLLRAPEVAKHVHDGKHLDVLLRRRGLALAGLASDPMIAAYLLDASRTRYDLDLLAAARGIVDVVPRAAWLGSGRSARAPGEVVIEDAAPRLAAEAAAALSLAPVQARELDQAGLAELERDLERPLARVLARIECHGIRVDADYLRALGQEVGAAIAALEREIHGMAGSPFNINSPKQLADVLFGKLGLPVVRRTKTGASTDADVLEELALLHPVPAKIVEYRGLTKLKGTYIDALPTLINPATGRLHTTFNQTVAATGRLSSSDPNLQNIPIRTEVGRRIRQAFIADPGHRIVSADYSQIELRILAHFSEDPAFLDAFRSGQDIHQRTAAEVFGARLDAVTAEQRRVAKAINFGLVFGQSDFGLSQVLRIPRAKAREYIDSYFNRYAGVRAYMDRAIAEARATGQVSTLLGRRRPLPGIGAARQQDRSYAERIARNTPIQGSAADILKLAMIRVDADLEAHDDARLLLTVHDELVLEAPEARVADLSARVKHQMESVVKLLVPLVVDVGSGLTWGAAH